MADIELDNLGEDEKEEDRQEEDTSFTENTDNANAVYDNIRSQINSEQTTQTRANTGLSEDGLTDLEKQIQNHAVRKAVQRYEAIQALETATDTRFSVTHGDSSKELIDNTSDVKYDENDKLIALIFKGKDVKLTVKGEIDKRYTQNKGILKAIEKANDEYDKSLTSVINESSDTPMSDEAVASVQENVADNLQDLVWDRYNEISQNDLDKNIEREINGILPVDDNVDYDDLSNPNQRTQYNTKIAGLDVNIEHWKYLEEREQDPTKKLLYKTAKELCVAKKSHMEVKAGFRPESEEALSMIQEETKRNDLTRLERFKKWAKKNIAGVSAVAISGAGIITTVVMAGRKAVKQGAKAVGEFGKAVANLAKKAAPAIATILYILAHLLTWGAKAIEFPITKFVDVALAITYFLYNEVKKGGRGKIHITLSYVFMIVGK